MAVKIIKPNTAPRNTVVFCECEILADTESDITALGETVADNRIAVRPAPGSWAYTADMSALYQMSPSGVWTKTGG